MERVTVDFRNLLRFYQLTRRLVQWPIYYIQNENAHIGNDGLVVGSINSSDLVAIDPKSNPPGVEKDVRK